MADLVSEYMERVLNAPHLDKLKDITSDTLKKYGFGKYSYLGLNPHPTTFVQKFPSAFYKSVFVQSTYPQKWVAHYKRNFFFYVDPILGTAKTSFLPFWWDVDRSADVVSRQEKIVLKRGGEHGIKRGIVVPIHAPAGEFAALALATDEGIDELEKIWEDKQHELHLIGTYYHAAIWEKFFQRKVEPTPRLSPRELQCLQWSARGKTIWEISKILGVSQATAKFYMQSAMHKMNTNNKTHAVSKALVHGLIAI